MEIGKGDHHQAEHQPTADNQQGIDNPGAEAIPNGRGSQVPVHGIPEQGIPGLVFAQWKRRLVEFDFNPLNLVGEKGPLAFRSRRGAGSDGFRDRWVDGIPGAGGVVGSRIGFRRSRLCERRLPRVGGLPGRAGTGSLRPDEVSIQEVLHHGSERFLLEVRRGDWILPGLPGILRARDIAGRGNRLVVCNQVPGRLGRGGRIGRGFRGGEGQGFVAADTDFSVRCIVEAAGGTNHGSRSAGGSCRVRRTKSLSE